MDVREGLPLLHVPVLLMWIAFLGTLSIFYANRINMPTVLLQEGYSSGTVFRHTSIIVVASMAGTYFTAFAPQRLRRKLTLSMSFILTDIGVLGSSIYVAVVAVVGLRTVALSGAETRGKTIEQVSEVDERAT